MGILNRIITIIKANINHLIGKAEDPEKMLNQMMMDMKEQYIIAKKQVAQAIADEKEIKIQYNREVEQSQHWETRAMQAVEAGNEELAREALARKAEHDNNALEFKKQWDAQKASVDELKSSLQSLNKKIDEVGRKKNLLIAKDKRAKAQKQIHETMAGLNDKSAFEAFERMDQKVGRNLAEAEAAEEISKEATGDQLEKKFESLGTPTSASVDEALSNLKAKMGIAPQSAAAGETEKQSANTTTVSSGSTS